MLRPRFALLLGLLILAPVAYAQEQDSIAEQPEPASLAEPAEVLHQGRSRWAVGGSHGVGVEINNSEEINISSVWVRWTQVLGGPQMVAGTKKILGGQPAIGIEVSPFSTFSQSPRAWGGSGHIVFEHRLRPQQKVRPVVWTGAGVLFTSREVPPGETTFNYTLFMGAGVEIAVSERGAIQLDYRLWHVSNLNTGRVNPGINAHTIVAGFAWGF